MTKDMLLSIAVLAAFALVWGGWRNLRGGRDKKRGWLMLGAAGVLLMNLWVLTLPVPRPVSGQVP